MISDELYDESCRLTLINCIYISIEDWLAMSLSFCRQVLYQREKRFSQVR